MACVAEGVEEPAQREWLIAQGVTVAQGYLLHRPLAAAALEAVLRADGPSTARG
jgi:EAL domain-containing protein (putative c-di-GMP-specific phosphodiesterase class I)